MVVINGNNLTIKKLKKVAFCQDAMGVAKSSWAKVNRSSAFVAEQISSNKTIYGFNTGFGALAQVRIDPEDLKELQHNILLSHNAGVGPQFASPFVRAAIALRINTLIRGYSGVTERLVRTLLAILKNDVVPIVPQKGSVGASGDLAPMAAIGLSLIGKGEVLYRQERMSAKRALKSIGLQPLKLKPKEGLSLINGTQFSTAIAALVNHFTDHLCNIADTHGALTLDALRGSNKPFDPKIFELRPHPGAVVSARNIRNLLMGSKILKSHRKCATVQDPYSLRCMAQVHGAVRDICHNTRKTIEIEMNSVTDNPLVFAENKTILSSGNFHAEPIAFALDTMSIGLAELASISERRIFRLLDSRLSGLNSFLSINPGLNSGFMMAQVTAASLVAQNKILSHPASVDSIPTSANQEDHVSMSMNAGLKAMEIVNNTKYVLAIEALCACQALDLLKPLKTSKALEKIKKIIRKHVRFMEKDQSLSEHIEKLHDYISKQLML
ncbi:MAG: histidine ammonia-lyase [bacterium]